MDMHEIEIEIDEKGEAAFVVNGIKGGGCKDVVKIFQNALGDTKMSQSTNEYYERPKPVKIRKKIRIVKGGTS